LQRVSCLLGAQHEPIPFERYGQIDFLTPLGHVKTILYILGLPNHEQTGQNHRFRALLMNVNDDARRSKQHIRGNGFI
jgi:hypothetical protein